MRLVYVFKKYIEKFTSKMLINYLSSFNVQKYIPYVFTQGKSTEDALINSVNIILENMNNKYKACASLFSHII